MCSDSLSLAVCMCRLVPIFCSYSPPTLKLITSHTFGTISKRLFTFCIGFTKCHSYFIQFASKWHFVLSVGVLFASRLGYGHLITCCATQVLHFLLSFDSFDIKLCFITFEIIFLCCYEFSLEKFASFTFDVINILWCALIFFLSRIQLTQIKSGSKNDGDG